MSDGQLVRERGNFSNGNRDTFDPSKGYVGVRLQQGVPLLDRDWNELEDTRRHFERMLRKFYIGDGVPSGVEGFKIDSPPASSPNNFVIRAGRCLVDGYDVANDADLLYSAQAGVPTLPIPAAPTNYVVYLEVWVEAVTAAEDPSLRNAQDINLETCIRDQLRWMVKVMPWPLAPGTRSTSVLAAIERPANANAITGDMITDLRRLNLTLADVVDLAADLKPRVQAIEAAVDDIRLGLTEVNQRLGRLFWDVDVNASATRSSFGETVAVTATVTNALGPVAGRRVEFSTDYGSISPASAVTDAQGRATATLVGVEADRPPDQDDLRVLNGVVQKINANTRTDRTVLYAGLKFTPLELGIVSKFSPPSTFVNIEPELKRIPPAPPARAATVSCYAKEATGTIVRGIGTIQVTFAQWVRDWVKTKIGEIVDDVEIGSRVGAKFGAAFANRDLNVQAVQQGLQEIYADVAAETDTKLGSRVFPDLPTEEEKGLAGIVGQAIALGVTNQVGQKANQVVTNQISDLQDQGLDRTKAGSAQKTILQASNQAQAAVAQGHKVRFGGGGLI